MKITHHHSSSSHGIPVILDDDGTVMDYGPGLTLVCRKLNWSRDDFARNLGYKSKRSVEKFWQGAVLPAEKLNMLSTFLR